MSIKHVSRVLLCLVALTGVPVAVPVAGLADATPPTPAVDPESVVDLRTSAGTALVSGMWRYSDAQPVQVPFHDAGPDRTPSGPPDVTHALTPAAMTAGFDDSSWQTIAPETLEDRRGGGKVSFNWYRLHFTIPKRLGSVDPTGDDVVFEIMDPRHPEQGINYIGGTLQ